MRKLPTVSHDESVFVLSGSISLVLFILYVMIDSVKWSMMWFSVETSVAVPRLLFIQTTNYPRPQFH